MPGNKHLPGATPKQNRQYEHIKDSYKKRGLSDQKAKERAARTVNKLKSRKRRRR